MKQRRSMMLAAAGVMLLVGGCATPKRVELATVRADTIESAQKDEEKKLAEVRRRLDARIAEELEALNAEVAKLEAADKAALAPFPAPFVERAEKIDGEVDQRAAADIAKLKVDTNLLLDEAFRLLGGRTMSPEAFENELRTLQATIAELKRSANESQLALTKAKQTLDADTKARESGDNDITTTVNNKVAQINKDDLDKTNALNADHTALRNEYSDLARSEFVELGLQLDYLARVAQKYREVLGLTAESLPENTLVGLMDETTEPLEENVVVKTETLDSPAAIERNQ